MYQHTTQNGVVFNREYPSQSGRLQAVPDAAPDGGVLLGTGSQRVLNGDDQQLVEKFARLVQQGVAAARITVVPHGEDDPRGEGRTRRERHASDRRVEITLEGEGSERVRRVRQRDDLQVGRRGPSR